MLILSRKIGEAIIIGDNVIITMLSKNKYGEMRIGIEAPIEISVHREEIYNKIKAEKNTSEE